MAEIDPVILELRAELGRYRAELKSSTSLVQKQLGSQERSVQRLEAQMRRSSGAIGNSLRGIATTLGTYFTGRELAGLIDGFTRLQNNLRVAGLEGENLARVQSQLLDLSSRYGTSVEGLSGVFLKASLAQNELGASTQQIIQLNEIVAASLKITGTSAQEAQGALLQLGQALGSGVVRAEEFNSILEGALPLAQAAARGIDGYGGSVSKLRAAVADGKITSQQFFEGVLKGGVQTLKDAEKATLTLSGAFEALSSKLTVYVGESAKANGITGALAGAMMLLADNLDTVVTAMAVIGTALGVGFVANAARARIAAIATAGAMTTMGAAASSVSALLGGPLGIAITAVVLGLGYLSAKSREAEAAAAALKQQYSDSQTKLDGMIIKLREAGVSTDELARISEIAAGRVDKLADKYQRASVEAHRMATEISKATIALLAQAAAAGAAGKADADRASLELQAERRNQRRREGFVGLFGGSGDPDRASADRIAALEKRIEDGRAEQNRANAIQEAALIAFDRKISLGDTPSSSAPAAPGKPKKGPKPPKDRTDELAARAAQDRYNLEIEQLRAQADLATGVEERADFERQILAKEREARYAELDAAVKSGDLTKAQADEQRKILRALYGRRDAERNSEEIEVEGQKSLYGERVERERLLQNLQNENDLAEERHRGEVDALRNQLDLATTDDERRRIALEIFDAEERYLRARLQAVITAHTINGIQDQEAKLAQARLDALNASAEDRRKLVEKANQGALGRYIEYISDTKARTEEAVVRQLRAVNDGITDALTSQLGIKNKFVKDMFSIFLDQVVFKPLAEALQNGIAGGGIGGFFGSIFSSIFGRASGGYAAPGSIHRVNEHAGGVELLRMGSQGGTVIPLGQVNARAGGGGSQTVIHQTVNVDARGVNPQGFANHIVAEVRKETVNIVARASNATLKAMPGKMASYQQDGTI